ncbi:hypothetical protein [Neolewinella agarilytica]|uniref:Uncharacterized protein n=1 Tax=Neolewinella agarilytica TaxID=478744 RepID=A0A1H9N517_9BACT|nr:hypothetical protein [Neolewinella agarilytica]SER31150.1 hypothetical protein SAMN05444359_1343 [Neolewinella agarilytica]
MIQEVEETLSEDEKDRFKPMIPFFYERRQLFKEYLEFASADIEDAPYSIQELEELYTSHLDVLEERTTVFMAEFGEQMDLSENELKFKLKYYQDNFWGGDAWPMTEGLSASDFTIRRDLLTLKYLTTLTQLVENISSIAGGKMLICFPPPSFFPVIQDGFSDPKLGEEITTTISIGKLDHSLNPEEMFIVINSDTLRLERGWREAYSFKPTRRGKQVLEMSLFGKNPLTGAVYSEGKNYYSFHVR